MAPTSNPLDSIAGEDMEERVRSELRVKLHDDRKLAQSLADIVDNSIDAGANNIDIMCREAITHDGKESYSIVVLDDGFGIEKESMQSAMSYGSGRIYEVWELGNFGVGMKDSSLAQASDITMISKIDGQEINCRRLSKEVVYHKRAWVTLNENDLQILGWDQTAPIQYAKNKLGERHHGTAVILENMHSLNDILVGNEGELEAYHTQVEIWLTHYLGLIFHRYLDGIAIGPRVSENPLNITVNGNPVSSIDPFMSDEQDFDGDDPCGTIFYSFTTTVPFQGGNEYDIPVNVWLLPNKGERERRCPGYDISMIRAADSELSINQLQGMYFMRNERLIDWPYNGPMWRGISGLGDSHHTVARWEIVLPPDITDEPSLLDPSKTRVKVGMKFKKYLQEITKEKVLWSTHDSEPYGYLGTQGAVKTMKLHGRRLSGGYQGVVCSKRARERTDGHDIAAYCSECNSSRVLIENQMCLTCQPPPPPDPDPDPDPDPESPESEISFQEMSEDEMGSALVRERVIDDDRVVEVNREHLSFEQFVKWLTGE